MCWTVCIDMDEDSFRIEIWIVMCTDISISSFLDPVTMFLACTPTVLHRRWTSIGSLLQSLFFRPVTYTLTVLQWRLTSIGFLLQSLFFRPVTCTLTVLQWRLTSIGFLLQSLFFRPVTYTLTVLQWRLTSIYRVSPPVTVFQACYIYSDCSPVKINFNL
jgi:hypothetical protein